MSKDYLQKEPTKTEKMLYDIAVNQQILERRLASLSSQILALVSLTKTSPEEFGKLLAGEQKELQELAEKVNVAIKSQESLTPENTND